MSNYKISLFSFMLIVFFLLACTCKLGIDVSTLQTKEVYSCMKNQGYQFAVLRAYHSYGALDTNAIPGLTNARQAGLQTDVYMFPCRGKNASQQVDELITGLPANLYDTIWVDVETNPSPNCSWANQTSASNCDFLLQSINRVKFHKRKVGIYTTTYFWNKIFGSYDSCPQAAAAMLWYAKYDNQPSFNEFTRFSGFTQPKMKQYLGDVGICGANSDKNFRLD